MTKTTTKTAAGPLSAVFTYRLEPREILAALGKIP